MTGVKNQTTLFRGVYEFEDPSGSLIAGKVPVVGSIDLYAGTAVIVKPNQCVVFIHKGQIGDVLFAGTHQIETENIPILTRLANWKMGFQSPLRAELVFISGQVFTARRWGTPQPVLVHFEGLGAVPVRVYGNASIIVTDPKRFYTNLMGSRSAFSISDLEDVIQGQIVELLPEVLASVRTLSELSRSHNEISRNLEAKLNEEIKDYGVAAQKIQVLSALPSKEILEAIDAKTAIQVIGSQKEYLLYKAASSLGQGKDGVANDPMQMMMGLMLGKGLMGADYHEKEEKVVLAAKAICEGCRCPVDSESKFCSQCGRRLK